MKRKIAIIYGIISGLLIVSSWFISYFLENIVNFGMTEIVGYVIMIIALSAVFMGIKRIRDEKGSMTFKEGFLNGLGITLVASTIYVVGWMIYVPSFAPDFADKYGNGQIALLEQSDLNLEEKNQQIEELKSWIEDYKKPHVMAATTFIEIFPVGLIITLISAFILKTSESE